MKNGPPQPFGRAGVTVDPESDGNGLGRVDRRTNEKRKGGTMTRRSSSWPTTVSRTKRGRNSQHRWPLEAKRGALLVEVNDRYALYEGQIDGGEIKGPFSNEMGTRGNWNARRTRESVSAPVPK